MNGYEIIEDEDTRTLELLFYLICSIASLMFFSYTYSILLLKHQHNVEYLSNDVITENYDYYDYKHNLFANDGFTYNEKLSSYVNENYGFNLFIGNVKEIAFYDFDSKPYFSLFKENKEHFLKYNFDQKFLEKNKKQSYSNGYSFEIIYDESTHKYKAYLANDNINVSFEDFINHLNGTMRDYMVDMFEINKMETNKNNIKSSWK